MQAEKGELMSDIALLQEEFQEYSRKRRYRDWDWKTPSPLWAEMDRRAQVLPGASAVELKAIQYEVIAERFVPHLFRHTPFFFEMGLKPAEARGVADYGLPASWLTHRNSGVVWKRFSSEIEEYRACSRHGIHLGGIWDAHHHSTNSTNIIRFGLESFYNEAEAELKNCATEAERLFLRSAMRGLLAVKRIAEKFAEAADRKRKSVSDPEETRFLEMISSAARRVPWKPAETFYEGLAMFPFLYEVIASLEGNGISAFGRLDYVLGPLYERDLAAGRITREEAYDLLCRALCFTDCRYDKYGSWKDAYNTQENGTAMSLGGYGDDGGAVCNEVTMMILEVHRNLNLLFPKLQLRICRETPKAFLDAANVNLLEGRNVLSFLNDDCIIAAQVRAGKRREDALQYAIGACWEVIVEGCEHSAGANCYFNLLRILELSIHDEPDVVAETGVRCRKLDSCTSFEEVYRCFLENVLREVRRMCHTIETVGRFWPEVNPSPFFSACMKDCLRNHRDYTAGGGRYNPHALPFAAFANAVDSLLAIRSLCFGENRACTLTELLDVLRRNWEGAEVLRQRALCSPFFGDGSAESNDLAKRLFDDLYRFTRDLKNERGGPFQLAYYEAWEFINWGKLTRATPDGRRDGDVIAQGLSPSHAHSNMQLTTVMNSVGRLDLTLAPGNSCLNISLPLGKVSSDVLEGLERAFIASGGAQLQPNCVRREDLEDAMIHPEAHRDLFVRVFGFSARFILLPPEWQREFINRHQYSA